LQRRAAVFAVECRGLLEMLNSDFRIAGEKRESALSNLLRRLRAGATIHRREK
jgi:hypothetical protein